MRIKRISILFLLLISVTAATSSFATPTTLGCTPNGVPYSRPEDIGLYVPAPTTAELVGPVAKPPGEYEGLGPATPGPNPPQNPAAGKFITAIEEPDGGLRLGYGQGPVTPRVGRPVSGPGSPMWGACHPSRFPLGVPAPQCGWDANPSTPGTNKTCPKGQICSRCQCVAPPPIPTPTVVTQNFEQPSLIAELEIGRELSGRSRANMSQLMTTASSFDSTTARANRGGAWYWFDAYPGFLVNLSAEYPGAELEIYFPGTKQSFSAQGGGTFRLESESDSAGNITSYFYDSSGGLTSKRIPGNLLLEYVPLVDGSAGYTLQISRCDPNYNSCASLRNEREYRLNSRGNISSVTELYPPDYVSEPAGPGAVHDLLARQNGALTTSYLYDPAGVKLLGVSQTRGGLTLPLVAYEYYPTAHLYADRLWKITDSYGQTTLITYGINQVIKTEPNGFVIEALFDSHQRITHYTQRAAPGSAAGVPYESQLITYAPGSTCDKLISKIERDRGDGVYQEHYSASWDSASFRLLSFSEKGPNGNILTTTFKNHVDWLEGNYAQEITSPSAATIVTPIYGPMPDSSDARFKLLALEVTTPAVTRIDGTPYSITKKIVYTATGQVDYEINDRLSTKYTYGLNGLLDQVDSGPATQAGPPDLSYPASYSIVFTRDPITGHVISSAEGDPLNPKVTNYTYTNGALTEVSEGLSRIKYFYNIWGALAATQVKAVDSAGNPFASGARTWWASYLIRDSMGLRVLAEAADIGDPRLPNSELWVTTYSYDQFGNVESVTPPFGYATFYKYEGWGNVQSVHRESPNGLLLEEYLETPYSTTKRVIAGEDQRGAATYSSLTSGYSPSGYLVSVSSSDGRQTRYAYSDRGKIDEIASYYNNTLISKFATEYDEWGRILREYRFNPVTGSKELVGAVLYDGADVGALLDDKGNRIVSYHYGPAGELLSEVTPLTKTDYKYQASLLTQITEMSGTKKQVVRYGYNSSHQLTKITDLGDGTQPGIDTLFSYDSLGQSSITRPDGIKSYELIDSAGRVWAFAVPGEVSGNFNYSLNSAAKTYTVAKTVAGEGTETNVFGFNGALSTNYPDGRSSRFVYSQNGFMLSASDPGGVILTLVRDAQGRVVGSDATGLNLSEQWRIARDSLDRIQSITRSFNNQNSQFSITRRGDYGEVLQVQHAEPGRATLTYDYDRMGPDGYDPNNIYGMSVGGVTWRKEIDSLTGQLRSLKFIGGNFTPQFPAEFKFQYNGDVQSGLTYPASTGLVSSWGYNRGRLDSVVVTKNNQILSGVQFERDNISNIKSQRTLGTGAGNGKVFSYDRNRLKSSKEKVTIFGSDYGTTLGAESTVNYTSANPQQIQSKILSSGRTIAFTPDNHGAYSKVDQNIIKYDAYRRVVAMGPYSYTYSGSSLLPREVRKSGKLVRQFFYDMFDNLMTTVDSLGQREDYLSQGTVDLGKLNPATGQLTDAYVTFPNPGTPREKLAMFSTTGGAHYYWTNLTPTERLAAYDSQGNLVEKYSTNYSEGGYEIQSPSGAVKSTSITGENSRFHGLRTFVDSGLYGGLSITPLRAVSPALSFFYGPDPQKIIGQRYSAFAMNPTRVSDPTGGQGWNAQRVSGKNWTSYAYEPGGYNFNDDMPIPGQWWRIDHHIPEGTPEELIKLSNWAVSRVEVESKDVPGHLVAAENSPRMGPVDEGFQARLAQSRKDRETQAMRDELKDFILTLGAGRRPPPRAPRVAPAYTFTRVKAANAPQSFEIALPRIKQSCCTAPPRPLAAMEASRGCPNARSKVGFLYGASVHPSSMTDTGLVRHDKAGRSREKLLENFKKSQERRALMEKHGYKDTPETRSFIEGLINQIWDGTAPGNFSIENKTVNRILLPSDKGGIMLELRWGQGQLNTLIPMDNIVSIDPSIPTWVYKE
jgi:YD repeat-containing protein